MGVRPRDSAKLGSLLICGSCDDCCGFACDPETVMCRFGTAAGSGMYSLALRFRVCWDAAFSFAAGGMGAAAPSSGTYTLRREAEVGLSADASMTAAAAVSFSWDSSPMLPRRPRVLGGVPPSSFFHGPGESAESSGLGRGVMSPMAEMTGLAMRLLAALPGPAPAPRLWARAVLRLGVLDIGYRLLLDALRGIATPPRAEK